jgi:hypothetical protein
LAKTTENDVVVRLAVDSETEKPHEPTAEQRMWAYFQTQRARYAVGDNRAGPVGQSAADNLPRSPVPPLPPLPPLPPPPSERTEGSLICMMIDTSLVELSKMDVTRPGE